MRNVLARAFSLVVAFGVLTLLVVHAGIAGCASRPAPADPWLANAPPVVPVPTAPVVSAAEPTPAAAPDPVITVGTGAGYLPATKAAPMLWANPPSPPPQQQAAPSPRQSKP